MFVADSYSVTIKMAGDYNHAKQILRREFYPPSEGFCVTIQYVDFIYTGGEEAGFVIGIENYPRFPSEPKQLKSRAFQLAETLIRELHQWSAMIVAPDQTHWINKRPEGQR